MRTSIQYSLLRLLLFFGCLLLASLIPPLRANVLWLLLVSTTVSMLIAVFALNGMRNRMSAELAERLERRALRRDQRLADETVEDEEDEIVPGASPR